MRLMAGSVGNVLHLCRKLPGLESETLLFCIENHHILKIRMMVQLYSTVILNVFWGLPPLMLVARSGVVPS